MNELLLLLLWGPTVVSLTFDDGPIPVTNKTLDVLRENRIKATFFVVGSNVRDNPDIFQRIKREGHEIGNHSYNHYEMDRLSKQRVLREFALTEKLIGKAKYYRPPNGSSGHLRYIPRGYKPILWNWSSGDVLCHNRASKREKSAIDCVREVKARLRFSGEGIALFHDSIWWTHKVIPEYLKRPEIVFVSLDFYLWYRDLKFGKKIIAWAVWIASRIGVGL